MLKAILGVDSSADTVDGCGSSSSSNSTTAGNTNNGGGGSSCSKNVLTASIRCNFCAKQCPSNTTSSTTSPSSGTTLTQLQQASDYRFNSCSLSAPPTVTHVKAFQQTGFCVACQEKYFGGTGSVDNSRSSTSTSSTTPSGIVICPKVERKSRRSFVTRSCSKMSHSSSSSSSVRSNNLARSCKSVSPGSYSCNALNVDLNSYTATHQWSKMLECAEFVGAKRSKHTVVSYKDAMYVFGGDNGKTMLNDLIRFGVKDKSWGRACATGTPPAPRYHHSAVVYGNSMFIFGGYTGDIHSNSNLTNKNDLFEYEFQRAMWVEWKFSGKMPVPRSAHGAAVYDNKMWIYAGYDGNARLNDMWTLNLAGENHQWEEIEQTGERPPTCCNFPVAVARDCMYVFSGQSGMQITNSLFEFNFKTKSWRRIGNEHVLRGVASQPPSRRYGHTMVHHDRFLYVFGGSADTTLPNDLHCYDLDTQVWSIIQPEPNSDVPSGRVFHASAVIADAMYIFGGTVDNSVRRGDTYRFQFSSYPKCTLRDDFGKFYSDKQFCDIQFMVGPEDIKIMAHIAFVAARSKYLRTKILAAQNARHQQMEKVFGSGCAEVRNNCSSGGGANQEPLLEVRLPNANPEAFEIILNYIYTDRIDLIEPYTKNIIILITDIFQLAGLFLMPRLAHGCIQYLDFKINKQNVLEALYNADRKNIQIVKDHCMQFIVKDENYTDVVMSNEFSDLDKPLLVEIIRKRLNPCKIITDPNIEKNVGTTLETDMAVFLETTGKDFCDINLMLEGVVIPAHKSILSARTQYFQAMFRSFMPLDNTVNISIGDILPSAEAFHSLLRYIYYGETKLPPQDALYLFQAPSFYGLANNRLHSFCKYSLENNINSDNVLQTLEAADYTKIYDIKDHALKLIVKDFARVARLPKIGSLSRELLLDIIQMVADSHACFNMPIGLIGGQQQQQKHHYGSSQPQNCLTP